MVQQRSHQSLALPSWMPFTFSSVLQHAAESPREEKKTNLLHPLPSSHLSSRLALDTLKYTLSVYPHVLEISCPIGFSFSSTCYIIGENNSLWMKSESWNHCWVNLIYFYRQRRNNHTMSLLYATTCAETTTVIIYEPLNPTVSSYLYCFSVLH